MTAISNNKKKDEITTRPNGSIKSKKTETAIAEIATGTEEITAGVIMAIGELILTGDM